MKWGFERFAHMQASYEHLADHAFLGVCIALVFSFFIWAAFSPLDIVSQAQGEVIPSSQIKTIQHLEGGIIREILVHEGEQVSKDQALVTLESTSNNADVNELTARLQTLNIKAIHLQAEINDAPQLHYPKALEDNAPDLIAQSIALFNTRKTRLQNETDAQKQLIDQYRFQLQEINARLNANKNSQKLLNEKISISEKLLKLNINNRMNHLVLLKESADLSGQIKEAQASQKRIAAAVQEAESRLQLIKNTFIEKAREDLRDTESSIGILQSQLQKGEDSLRRTVLKAPVDGTIKSLFVTTLGGVVAPGAAVLDIVPADDTLIIEAKLSLNDIGYVHSGQPAKIRLPAANASRFGHIDAEVVHISPDTITDKEGLTYYKIKINTRQSFFRHHNEKYNLFSGMMVQCNIITGQRTVLAYLLDPFISALRDPLTER